MNKLTTHSTDDNLQPVTDTARVLADPVRLRLLAIIGAAREIPCTRLVEQADVTASTVSYHIRILAQEGLISIITEGRHRHVRFETQQMRKFTHHLASLALVGHP